MEEFPVKYAKPMVGVSYSTKPKTKHKVLRFSVEFAPSTTKP